MSQLEPCVTRPRGPETPKPRMLHKALEKATIGAFNSELQGLQCGVCRQAEKISLRFRGVFPAFGRASSQSGCHACILGKAQWILEKSKSQSMRIYRWWSRHPNWPRCQQFRVEGCFVWLCTCASSDKPVRRCYLSSFACSAAAA